MAVAAVLFREGNLNQEWLQCGLFSEIPQHTSTHTHTSHAPQCMQVVLEIKSEQQLANLSQKLQQEGIQHKLWVEQPENYPTCLATKPYRKSQAAAHFKKLQLCKAVLTKG